MSIKSLADLAQFAATSQQNRNTVAVQDLSVEDARSRVVIKDGFRVKPEDGSQALTLTLGKVVVSLNAVEPNATRLIVPKASVEEVTVVLQAAIEDGTFDDAIVEAQAASKEAAEKRAATQAAAKVEGEEVVAEAPEGVDIDELG